MAVSYGNDAFQFLYFQLKTVLQIFEKKNVFKKVCFEVKVLKMFEIPSDYHIKAYRSF